MKKYQSLVFISMLLVTPFLGTMDASAQLPAQVKIGVALPLTGGLAMNGKEAKEGADLAAELINKNGGIKGKVKVELIYGDDRCEPTQSINITQRLIGQGIDFYIGNYCSQSALATMPILATEGIPQVVIAYAPSITGEARTANSVRFGLSAPIEMAPVAKYAVKVKGDKTFAAIGVNADYGREDTAAFASLVEKMGGKVIDFQFFPYGADFSTYLTKVQSMNVDAINVVAIGNDPVSFTKSYFELGLKKNVYTNCNFADTQYIEKQHPKPQNLFFSDVYDDGSPRAAEMPPPDPWVKEFYKEFELKYGKKPTRNNVWGYGIMRIYEEAVSALGTTDKKKIAEYLHSGKKFKTPFGEIGFAWCGQATNRCFVGKYEGEKIFYVKGRSWAEDVIPDPCPRK